MRWITTSAIWLALASCATAQTFVGNLPPLNVVGNPTGSAAPPTTFPIFSTANTWSVIQSVIGSNVSPIPNTDGAQFVVQNSATTAANILVPVTGGSIFDGVRSTVFIPGTSPVLGASGFGAYIRSRSGTCAPFCTFGNGVGFYGLVTAGASNTGVWFLNGRLSDTEDNLSHAYTNVSLIYSEADYFVTSAATVVNGYNLQLTSNIAGWTGAGFQISNLTPAFGKLTFAFSSGNAAAATGMSLGSNAVAGANVSSQAIVWNLFDSGSTPRFITTQAIPLGTLSAFSVTDTTLANGVFFEMAGAGTAPLIGALGSDTNINLTVTGKGTGSVVLGTGTGKVSSAVGVTFSGLPASAGAGGLNVCVDNVGVLYKKAACP